LNQLDGAGPPPASKDQIDALPMTTIVQEQVGEFMHFVLLFVAFNFHISTVFQWLDMVATWGRHLLLLFQRHPRRDGFLESKREDYENCSIL